MNINLPTSLYQIEQLVLDFQKNEDVSERSMVDCLNLGV